MIHRLAAAMVVFLLSSTRFVDANAQEDRTLSTGSRVRVDLVEPLERVTGTLTFMGRDSLVVRPEPPASPVAFSSSSIEKLEVSRGTKSRLGRGALFGFLIGSGTAVALATALCVGNPECSGQDGGLVFAFLGTLGAVGGTSIGMIVGARSRTDRWERVQLDRIGSDAEAETRPTPR